MKVASLVAGMVAGADCIDDMALLRHGGMGRVFEHAYAPSTLGSFLRSFTFGHVRQLDAVAARFLTALAEQAPMVAETDQAGGAGYDRIPRFGLFRVPSRKSQDSAVRAQSMAGPLQSSHADVIQRGSSR